MQMKKKYYYIYLLVFAVLCSAFSGCQQDREEPFSGDRPLPSPSDIDQRVVELLDTMKMYRFEAVQEAPSFELTSVTGRKVNLGQYRGKVVLLSFWATW